MSRSEGSIPTALILRALGLGDFLTAVPVYRAVRHALPDHETVLAAPPELAGLAALTGAIDRVVPAYPLRPVPWNSPPPQMAVNLHGKGPQSHRVLAALRPKRLVAFANPELPEVAGPVWYAEEHEVHRWCRLVEWVGIQADPTDLELPSPAEVSPAPGAVVLHPGAGAPGKQWPTERFAAVAAVLRRAGHRVVVTGSAAEVKTARRVAAAAGIGDEDVLAGRTSLLGLAALVAHADVVISADTGIAHLATAYATPSVVLFGSATSPEFWGPPPARPQHAVLRGVTLPEIDVEEVLASTRRVSTHASTRAGC